MNKFFHLISGTTFLGVIIASFFYIAHSLRNGDRALIDYSLKTSYLGDVLIFFAIIIQLITAANLISEGHFTLQVPWIVIAYLALGAVVLLWLFLLLIKYFYLTKYTISPITIRIFYLIYILIILIFGLIIHDAVTQSTWFKFLFRI